MSLRGVQLAPADAAARVPNYDAPLMLSEDQAALARVECRDADTREVGRREDVSLAAPFRLSRRIDATDAHIHKFVSHEDTVFFVTDEGDSVAVIADREATDCEQIIAASANNEGGLIRQHTCFGKKYLLQWPVERGR